jgi:hypothetical protein
MEAGQASRLQLVCSKLGSAGASVKLIKLVVEGGELFIIVARLHGRRTPLARRYSPKEWLYGARHDRLSNTARATSSMLEKH